MLRRCLAVCSFSIRQKILQDNLFFVNNMSKACFFIFDLKFFRFLSNYFFYSLKKHVLCWQHRLGTPEVWTACGIAFRPYNKTRLVRYLISVVSVTEFMVIRLWPHKKHGSINWSNWVHWGTSMIFLCSPYILSIKCNSVNFIKICLRSP